MKALLCLFFASVLAASFTSCATNSEANANIKPYPFDTCAVINKPLKKGKRPLRRVYQGQEVLFCCHPCVKAFDANPDPFMPRIHAAAAGGAEQPHVPGGAQAAANAAAEMGRDVQ